MSTHITVSHGRDFFGVDTIPVPQLRELGQYACGILPADGRLVQPMARLQRRAMA